MALGSSELLGEVAGPPGAHEPPCLVCSPLAVPRVRGIPTWARRMAVPACCAPFSHLALGPKR
eukprot:1248905-Alexandrium_andersonii.AAC.1